MRPRFSPGEKPERPADPAVRRANLRRVFGLFKAYRWRLSVVLALIGFSALLSIVSAVAGLIPARKASQIDPILALRYE